MMRMLLPVHQRASGRWQGVIATEYSTSLPLKSDRRWSLLRAPSELLLSFICLIKKISFLLMAVVEEGRHDWLAEAAERHE
jgi:hypothetical protein